jgi:TPP-dependent pyruvate/acetoin dehydrogenase alpha subunit
VTGEGPTFIEARTYRFSGHGSGEGVGAYRTPEEVTSWRESRDPITRCAGRLTELGVLTDSELEVLDKEAVETVDAAVRYAEESPWPEPME